MTLALKRMSEVELDGRRVLIREDLNAPIAGSQVTSDARLRAALPTIETALARGARVMLLSHLGRPKEGQFDAQFSLAPVAARLSELLGRNVPLAHEWLNGLTVEPGDLVLCENVRFLSGEKANDAALAKRMAATCDVFVMDAFGTAHRAQASTAGVARYAPEACAGPLLVSELEALAAALESPRRPVAAVVGGSKVSTKLEVLRSLASEVDTMILGGGIANTVIAAAGYDVGCSLVERDMVEFAARLLAGEFGPAKIPLPTDVVVAETLTPAAVGSIRRLNEVGEKEMILDIGPATAAKFSELLAGSGTIVWNGPLGVFEHPEFAAGTARVANAIAESGAFSIAGGGDTLAAIDQFGIRKHISYISTGGGAFLEFLEGKKLPAVAVLEERFVG
jgi:phosphoglycerate kinase